MKKWMKGFTIAGVIMFCLGVSITALAGAVGGINMSGGLENSVLGRTIDGVLTLPGVRLINGVDGFYWGHRDYDFDSDDIYDDYDDYDDDYDYDDAYYQDKAHMDGQGQVYNDITADVMPSKDGMTEIATYKGIKNLELEVEGGRVQVVENPALEDQIVIYERQKQNCAVSHAQKSGTSELEIRYYCTRNHSFSENNSGPEGIVEIPSGYRFDKASVDLKASAVVVSSINANQLELDVKAGDLVVSAFDAGILEADTEAGSITANGNVINKVSADVKAGSLALDLLGSKTDFNYDLEGASGTIEIGLEQYTGLAFEQRVNNSAAKTAELSSSIGTLKLTFK